MERHIKSHTLNKEADGGISVADAVTVTVDGAKLMTTHEVLTSAGTVAILGGGPSDVVPDDEDMSDMIGGDVVAVVGAVDDEDDLAV